MASVPLSPQPADSSDRIERDAQIERRSIEFTLNGQPLHIDTESWVTLLDLLRDRVGLTGTKKGCDHGQCGACTVLIDGRRELSCLTLSMAIEGCAITTVEGLSDGTALSDLQRAFVRHDAFQCGYCTPGQLCSAKGLINEGQAQSLDDVRELMSGNLCRCGAYPQIAQAVAEVMFGPGPHDSERTDEPIVTGTVPA